MPDAVRFCFTMVAAGTTCEGARLEIDEPPGPGALPHAVATRSRPARCFPLCDGCGSADIEVEGGRELRIREVEVA